MINRLRLACSAAPMSLAVALAGGAARAAAATDIAGLTVTGAPIARQLTVTSTTGSRLGLTPLETPATVQILSGDLIRQRGDITIADAVTRAAGVTTLPTPGNGGGAYAARGFSGTSSVMVLYDGVQLYVGSGTVTFPTDPWTVDRIEVLSGPSSVLYGSGAIGGVINVVPRPADPMIRGTEVQITGGAFGTARTAIDAAGALSSTVSYRLDVSDQRSDGWIDRGDNNSLAVSGQLRWDAAPNLKLVLQEDVGLQNPMPYYGEPVINGGVTRALRAKNYNVADAALRFLDNLTQLKAEWSPTANLTVRNTAYLETTDRHWRNEENFAYQPATGVLLRNGYLEIYHHEQQFGDHADLTLQGKLGGLDNTLSAGIDINRIRFQNVSNSPFPGTSTISPYSFDPGLFIHAAPTTPVMLTHTDQRAVYAEDRLVVGPGLSVIAGGRYDHYELTRLDARARTTTSHDYDTVSWRVGGVYEIVPSLSLYAQYATATDPVSSLITLSPAQQIFDLTTGKQVEIGAKQVFMGGRGEWTLAAYRIVKTNLLAPDPSNITIQQQIGQQSSRGIEASIAVSLTDRLRIEANATVLKARFDDFAEVVSGVRISRAGNRPTNVPNQTANAFATWDITPALQVRVGARYVGRRYANNANTLIVPSYAVYDAGARWTINDRLSVDLRAYNLTDEIYATSVYNGGAQRILGRPRAVEATLDAKF